MYQRILLFEGLPILTLPFRENAFKMMNKMFTSLGFWKKEESNSVSMCCESCEAMPLSRDTSLLWTPALSILVNEG